MSALPTQVGGVPIRANPSVACGDSSPFRRALIAPTMPPLKGEVPVKRAVGFVRCMAAARIGTAERQKVVPGHCPV